MQPVVQCPVVTQDSTMSIVEERDTKVREEIVDLEKAIDLTGFGRFHIILVLTSGTCISTMMTETFGVSFILPAAQCDLGLTTSSKGLLSGATLFGMIVSAHVWGFAADTMGRKKILLPALYGTWLASVLSSFAPNVWIFILLRFLVGFILCGMSSTIYAYLSEFLPARNRSVIMTWTCMSIAVAFLLIPGLAWVLLPVNLSWDLGFVVFKSWRLYIVIMGSFSFINGFVLLRYPESPKFLMMVGKKDEALQVLRDMYVCNTGKSEDEYPVKDVLFEVDETSGQEKLSDTKGCISPLKFLQIMWQQTKPLILRPYGWTTLLFCTIQFGIYVSSGGMYLWIPNILNYMTNFAEAHPNTTTTVCEVISSRKAANSTVVQLECNDSIGWVVYLSTLIIGCCYVVSYTAIGGLIAFFGKKKVLVSAQALSGLAGIGIYFARNEILLTTCMAAYVVLAGTCVSVLSAAVVDLYPTNLRTMAVSLALTSGRLGSAVAGNVIGILIEYNCVVAIIGMACVTLGCSALCLCIPRPKNTSSPTNVVE